MAEVIFLTGVGDKLAYACRLLRKKHREGARVAVFGPPGLLQRLDQALWRDEPLAFQPHRRLQPGEALPPGMGRTRLWLLSQAVADLNCDTAVNLGLEDVELFGQFARVAEVIGQDEDERQAGRGRWKRYEAQGHSLSHRSHSVAGREGD